MKKQGVCLLCFLWFSAAIVGAQPIEFHVAPGGDDANPGTMARPFKTIQRARQQVREHNRDMAEDIIVTLREGVYYLDETLAFNSQDSGHNGRHVIYRSYPDEKVFISGGTALNNWKQEKDGLFSADSHGLLFRQLYMDGRKAVRARTPNANQYFQLTAWDFADRRILVRHNLIHQYGDFAGAEMIVQLTWAESVLRIKEMQVHGLNWTKEAQFTFEAEESDLIFTRPYPQAQSQQYFHFENAKAFIDQPGEWYLDTEKQKVYLKPYPGQNPNQSLIIAPVLETIVSVTGTLDDPVKNIKFVGVGFAHSNWTRPSLHGNLNTQAGQYTTFDTTGSFRIWNHPPAGIYVAGAQNIVFEKNTFTHMGATGIDLHYGTKNCMVNGNRVQDISGNGISVGKFFSDEQQEDFIPYNPKDKRDVCTGDIISNNVIRRIGTDYYGSCGIAAGYPAKIRIVHNHIQDVPYTGISLGFGWSQALNAMHDNTVAYNDISDVLKMMVDGAGIYTLSMQPGTVIEKNRIANVKRTRWSVRPAPVAGIYCDEGTSGTDEKPFIIRNNLVAYGLDHFFMMHRVGIINFDNNIHSPSHEGGEDIAENVGPKGEYKNLLTQQNVEF